MTKLIHSWHQMRVEQALMSLPFNQYCDKIHFLFFCDGAPLIHIIIQLILVKDHWWGLAASAYQLSPSINQLELQQIC